MAQVVPLRPHTFRLDNCLIDDYAAEMGAIGVAIYAVLQRYTDRTTGQCWPKVTTIATALGVSTRCVQKYLRRLKQLGLIDIAPRYTAEGDSTSNLYTVHNPTQTEAVRRRRQSRGGARRAGGGAPGAPPPPFDRNVVHHPPAPDADEQDPAEQILTSVAAPKTAGQPCDNPAHEHRSPVPELAICLDCFRAWSSLRPWHPPSTRRAVSGHGSPRHTARKQRRDQRERHRAALCLSLRPPARWLERRHPCPARRHPSDLPHALRRAPW
jgi:GntR family transcriptional regulator